MPSATPRSFQPDTATSTLPRRSPSSFVADTAPAIPRKKALIDRLTDPFEKVADFTGFGKTVDTFGNLIAKATVPANQRKYINTPSLKDVAGASLNVGSTLIPVGGVSKLAASTLGKTAARIGAGAGTGYTVDVAQDLEEGSTLKQAIRPGVGTALGAAIPFGGEAATFAGLGAKTIASKAANNLAPRIINSVIKPLLKDFSYGKDPGRTIAQLGITGKSFEDLAANINRARRAIGEEAATLGQGLDNRSVVQLESALKPLDDAMELAASNNNPIVISRLRQVKDALTHDLTLKEDGTIIKGAKLPWYDQGTAAYTEALKLKQRIGDLTKFTGNPSDDKEVNLALKKAYGAVKTALNDAAKSADPKIAARLRKLNEQYADLTSGEIAAKYRDKIASRQNIISLPANITGLGAGIVTAIATGGSAIPAVLAAASGAAIEKALATPAVKTRIAAALARMKPAQKQQLYERLPFLKNFNLKATVSGAKEAIKDERGSVNLGAIFGAKGADRVKIEDRMRDAQDLVVRELKKHIPPRTGRQINFDIEDEVSKVIKQISGLRSPKPSDFQRALELIRLRGGSTGQIRSLLNRLPSRN